MKKNLLALALVLAMVFSLALPGIGVAAAAGEKVINLYTDAVYRTMDQRTGSDANLFEVMGNFSEGLLRLDKDNNPQPALAESYTISDDGLTYTFKLRAGLVWSNGTPLTAKDFVYGWIIGLDPNAGYSSVIAPLIKNGDEFVAGKATADQVGIRAVDDQTFEVQLAFPASFFDRLITLPVFFPLNQAFVEAEGANYALTAKDILYCGPFVCSQFDLGVGVTLEKNPTYWDAANVKVDKVNFRVITDASAALNAYEAGEIDRVNLTSNDVAAYKDSPDFGTRSDFRNIYVQFDMSNPTMNLNIRKALSDAIDRETLVNSVLQTGAVAAGGVVSQGIYGDATHTFRQLAGTLSKYDPDAAKQEWAKGVAELGGTAPKLTLLTATGPAYDDVAVFLQDQWRTVLGADVTINAMTQKARNDIMLNQTYDMGLSAWGADYDDAMTFLALWTDNTGYRGNYAAPAYCDLITQAMREPDPAKRVQIMVQAEQMLIGTDMVVTGVYDRGFSYLQRATVKGLVYHPVGAPLDLKWATVE